MGREERTIEVTVISATDLKKVMKFGREQKCYVVAYVYPARKETSPTDFYGGNNPVWNAILKVKCYETDVHPEPSTSSPSAHMMTLEIYSHVSSVFHKTDKHVGTVTVPLQRVASAAQAGGAMSPFDVYLATGGVQGSLNLSVKLGAKRELGEYEDLSAALSSSHSGDQNAPPSIYRQGSDEVPRTQYGSQTAQAQSSHGIYPPPNDHSTASPSKNPFAAEGQPSYGNNPPRSKNPFAAEGQSSYGINPSSSKNPFAAEGQSSYGNNPPPSKNPFAAEGQSSYGNNPPPMGRNPFVPEGQSSYGKYPPPNPSTSAVEDDVVTGYPVPEYTFAPLGQLPRQGQEQSTPYTTPPRPSGTPPGPYTTAHGPYATLEPAQDSRLQRRRDRKRGGRERRRGGPIHLGLMVLQATLAPVTTMIMGGRGRDRRQGGSDPAAIPSSSYSSQPWPDEAAVPSSSYSSQPGKPQARPQDPTDGPTKGRYS